MEVATLTFDIFSFPPVAPYAAFVYKKTTKIMMAI
tara:strand:- start:652 stop:756 length:105 start_codon:yes stop_codon:yes gene_type:complete